MISTLIRTRRKQILIDIDTQKDYLLADGKACIRNHRRVLAHIRRIMAWARSEHIPIISTAEVYPNNNGESAIGYCIDGTDGQKKVRYTLMKDRVSLAADGNTDFYADTTYPDLHTAATNRDSDSASGLNGDTDSNTTDGDADTQPIKPLKE